MPSNKELQSAIAEIAEKHGLTVDTSGMKNATLSTTLSGLREQYPEAEPAPKHGVRVAKGRSITSPRGILADGEVLRDGDIADAETVDVLIGLGVLEKF